VYEYPGSKCCGGVTIDGALKLICMVSAHASEEGAKKAEAAKKRQTAEK
jgi:hypothetical protein